MRFLLIFRRVIFLLIQNEISQLPYLIEKAYAAGMRVIFNPSPFQQSLGDIDLNKISYLILNEIEAAGFRDFPRRRNL